VDRRHLEPWFSAQAFPPANDAKKSGAHSHFLARLPEMRPKRAIGVYARAEDGKHPFYLLTLQPGADLARLVPPVDGFEWDKP
jgi:hypothetical protein